MYHWFGKLFQSLASIFLEVFDEMFHRFDERFHALLLWLLNFDVLKLDFFKQQRQEENLYIVMVN